MEKTIAQKVIFNSKGESFGGILPSCHRSKGGRIRSKSILLNSSRFLDILNTGVHQEFADHLIGLQNDPNRYFAEALFCTTECWWTFYTTYRTLPLSLWNLSALVILVIPGVTSTISGEAMKHSNRTRQTTKKLIKTT